jgi:hypothetical protein
VRLRVAFFQGRNVEQTVGDRVQLNMRELPAQGEQQEHVVVWGALDADDATANVAVCAYELAHVFARCAWFEDKEAIPAERRELGKIDFRRLLLMNFFADTLADHARAIGGLGATEEGDCGNDEGDGECQRRVHLMPNGRTAPAVAGRGVERGVRPHCGTATE